MKLADTNYDNSATGCCAPVDRATWDEKSHHWEDKLFLKDHIRSFLHIPLNFGSVISRDHAAIEQAAAYPETPLWMTDEVSPWGADIYVAVDKPVPGATIETISGDFVSKVFEGPYRDIGKWNEEMKSFVRSRGRELSKLYYFYATCPRCQKALGRNEVVLVAQVS